MCEDLVSRKIAGSQKGEKGRKGGCCGKVYSLTLTSVMLELCISRELGVVDSSVDSLVSLESDSDDSPLLRALYL